VDLQTVAEEVTDVGTETMAATCPYCSQPIRVGQDAQNITKRQYAHTACAFAVDGAFWFLLLDMWEGGTLQ
jgi:hypothetical protein